MSIPPGSYPGSYHLIDFGERFTSTGAEATMVFAGPSLNRYTLIGSYFPLWFFTANPLTGVCCADLIPGTGPTAYPDLLSAQIDENVDCAVYGTCLWPDSYSVEPGTNTCTPQPLPCTTPPAAPVTSYPLYYSDGTLDQCDARITINFRRKHHAGWPRYLYPCNGEEAVWQPPVIPTGTYIEVRENPNTEAKTIPGTGLNYLVDEIYTRKNDVSVPIQNCNLTTYPIVAPTADWCNAAPASTALANEQFGALVFAQELEVRWSGVPMASWETIRQLEGTVNSSVWLGYPPESVLFSHYEREETPMFGCQDLYTVVLHFNILTGAVDTFGTTLSVDEQVVRGIYKSRVGLWNRVWSDEPMVIGTDEICTNWVPIRNRLTNCCGSSNLKVYLADCFDTIFSIPSCPP